jgi:hypothetical protein
MHTGRSLLKDVLRVLDSDHSVGGIELRMMGINDYL